MYVAILAHEREDVLAAQISNLRQFVPGARIVVFNGGSSPRFGESLDVPVCPYSRPLDYGNLAAFHFGVMKWLEETEADYEFLVTLDSDVLFVRHGFETFVREAMEEYDMMGYHFQIQNTQHDYPEFIPGLHLWAAWPTWRKLLRTDYFGRFFNPGLVFRRGIIRCMLKKTDFSLVDQLWTEAPVFALEEMLLATLALKFGGKCRDYLWSFGRDFPFVRFRPFVTGEEVKAAWGKSSFFWCHPVKGDLLLEMNEWLRQEEEKNPREVTQG